MTWLDFYYSWEAMQDAYVPNRWFILQTLHRVLPIGPFRFLDLCSGPGSVSRMVLKNCPHAKGVALDKDPTLLELGRQCFWDFGGRLQVVVQGVEVFRSRR